MPVGCLPVNDHDKAGKGRLQAVARQYRTLRPACDVELVALELAANPASRRSFRRLAAPGSCNRQKAFGGDMSAVSRATSSFQRQTSSSILLNDIGKLRRGNDLQWLVIPVHSPFHAIVALDGRQAGCRIADEIRRRPVRPHGECSDYVHVFTLPKQVKHMSSLWVRAPTKRFTSSKTRRPRRFTLCTSAASSVKSR